MVSVLSPTSSAVTVSDVVITDTTDSRWLKLSTNTSGARYFVDVNGNPVNLWGMARCQSHADEEDILFSQKSDVNSLTDHYASLGCNWMRLAINLSDICTVGGNVSKEEIGRFISKEVDPDVQAIIRRGMYVMLDVHMYPPSAPEGIDPAVWTVQYAYDNYLPFLTELAKKYSNEPMVAVYELWNEPYPADQVSFEYDFNTWNTWVRNFFIDAVNEIRKYDTRHVLMVSDWNAGWGCAVPETWNGYYDQLDPVYRNTAHSIHVAKSHMDDSFAFYKDWYTNLAANNNLCLIFGEIETEAELMSENGIQNLMSMFSELENTHHFSGMLWRPHGDESTYVSSWSDWAKDYTSFSSQKVLRDVIEAENFYALSENADFIKDSDLFGSYDYATGIVLSSENNRNDYYEADTVGGKIYPAGEYSLTVTSKVLQENTAGFIVGYRTVDGNIYQIAEFDGNSNIGEIYDQTVSFKTDSSIASIVFFSNGESANSVAIDRVYIKANASAITQDWAANSIDDVDFIYSHEGMVYTNDDFNTDSIIITENTVLNPNHWYSDSLNFNSTANSVVMGHSKFSDSYYSRITYCGGVEFVETDDGNYFNITTSNGWDPDFELRYGPHNNNSYIANTENATHVYMTVKFDAENLSLFKNAKVFSKNVIGEESISRSADTALVLKLGDDSGVTFKTWKNALNYVTPNVWTTLKLEVTNGENATPNSTLKDFYFKFGEQLAASFSLRGIKVTSEIINPVVTKGAKIAFDDSYSLLFISEINKTLLPDDALISDFGTLVTYEKAYKHGEGDMIKNSTYVYNEVDYPVCAIKPESKEIVYSDSSILFSSQINNITDFSKGFAICPYVEYSVGNKSYIAYGKTITRSIYDISKKFEDISYEDFDLTITLLDDLSISESRKEINLLPDSQTLLSGSQWYPQLYLETLPTAVGDFNYIQFNLYCPDINTVINKFSAGSRCTLDGGSFSYLYNKDLGIYFDGVGVSYSGVLQSDLRDAFNSNKAALAAGKTVTLKLKLSGSFAVGAVVDGINFMMSHGNDASYLDNIPFVVSDLKFVY